MIGKTLVPSKVTLLLLSPSSTQEGTGPIPGGTNRMTVREAVLRPLSRM